VLVYVHRKELQKAKLVDAGSSSTKLQELAGPSLFVEVLHQENAQGLDGVALPLIQI